MAKKHSSDSSYSDEYICRTLEADFANFESKIKGMSINLAFKWYQYLNALASNISNPAKRREWRFKIGGLRDKYHIYPHFE